MNNQIFKAIPDNKLFFDLLDKICIKNDKYFLIDRIAYKKGLLSNDINLFLNNLLDAYYSSKKYYLTRELTYNSFLTVVRQLCKINTISFTSKIKYNKSKYEIVYYIYF